MKKNKIIPGDSEGVESIRTWRKLFGLPVNKDFNIPVREELDLDIRLVREEIEELEDAYDDKDLTEQIDALTDIAFVIEQLFCRYGFIGQFKKECTIAVTTSNLSKLCYTEEDAILSVEKINREKAPVKAYYEKRDSHYIILREGDNKVMKGIHFKEPDFEEIIKKYGLRNNNATSEGSS